ncbi:DNA-directed RNA polymerase subunit delta [Pradoshia sp. D12]|uniref:DNA-directed RNA polymerase subunit delta n=1 Tax=Bacillaceae TaxID=186817 RepID=UPI00080ADCF3|nr:MULTISPECIES: DNA-directed RNA polymerase subunit delta [Bacillaceae]OCA81085.1 DNA-directed RNA polymerase subunit delta [Bacillus sp. FJAT-27986]QFK73015.1 DNA-directed RNA polymerase subunit delta [Pradoshia sp. D12]TPF72007.1 DNA-directed RNA polymerase subunit delta [Bacillus sp. D12]
MKLANLSKEEVSEMAYIEIANVLLIEKKEAIDFKVMMDKIQKLLGLTDEEVSAKMGQFYTDLNVDGRFISIGDNRWGLKGWYPVEQVEEETVPASKVKKKKKGKKALVDDFDDEDEVLDFDDLDDFDDDDDEDDSLIDDFDDIDDIDDDEDDDDEDLIEDEVIVEDDYDLDDEEEEEEDLVIDEEEEDDNR